MMVPSPWTLAFTLLGGLGLFLLGMKHISEGMQALVGERLRRMLSPSMAGRLRAAGVGAGTSAAVQSSSITTVIVVGLVNSGLLALPQAIGMIMGANVGTTAVGWVLALGEWVGPGAFGLPVLGAAIFFYLFSRSDRWRYIALAVMGLGMIFFGLALMKRGLGPMGELPAVRSLLPWLAVEGYAGVLRCALVGCLVTFILQSSAGTLGLVIALVMTGLVSLPAAGAMVVGLNVGTTLTAALASVGATTAGRRAGYAHVLFNLFGAVWAIALSPWLLIAPLEAFGGGAAGGALAAAGHSAVVGVAAVHTAFNLVNTAVLLPVAGAIAPLLRRLVPETETPEAAHLTQLDVRVIESPIIGIEQSRGEILKMAEGVGQMYEWTRRVLDQEKPDPSLVRRIFHREQTMDSVQQEIIDFLTDLLTGSVPHSVTEEGRSQLRIADEYESISDYISTVLKSHLRLRNAGLSLAEEEREQIAELHGMVGSYLAMITEAVRRPDGGVLERAYREGRAITARFKVLRGEHLSRLEQTRIDPVRSMSYNAMLTAYRRIKDHALNIAEALAGEK